MKNDELINALEAAVNALKSAGNAPGVSSSGFRRQAEIISKHAESLRMEDQLDAAVEMLNASSGCPCRGTRARSLATTMTSERDALIALLEELEAQHAVEIGTTADCALLRAHIESLRAMDTLDAHVADMLAAVDKPRAAGDDDAMCKTCVALGLDTCEF